MLAEGGFFHLGQPMHGDAQSMCQVAHVACLLDPVVTICQRDMDTRTHQELAMGPERLEGLRLNVAVL